MRVSVRESTVCDGLGVFAAQKLYKGQILEVCSVFPFSADDSVLHDHRLVWTDTEDAMASGNACLYNHSDTPNVEFQRLIHDRSLFVVALRDISMNEELFKKYACEPWW